MAPIALILLLKEKIGLPETYIKESLKAKINEYGSFLALIVFLGILSKSRMIVKVGQKHSRLERSSSFLRKHKWMMQDQAELEAQERKDEKMSRAKVV